MKFVKPLVAASALAVASTAAVAGGLNDAETTIPVIIPPETAAGSAGSLGSLGGAAPAIIAAIVIAAAASSSGGS